MGETKRGKEIHLLSAPECLSLGDGRHPVVRDCS